MGAVGGTIGAGTTGQEVLDASLRLAVHRGPTTDTLAVGDAIIGVQHGGSGQSWLGRGERWAVALTGCVDRVGGVVADDPADALIALLESSGPAAFGSVLGDVTGVATDGHKLVAFRDHLGSDGLFTAATGSVAAVMSEPKQVLGALGRSRRPDIDALVAVYFSQWEAEDDLPSVVEGVDRIPRAAVVEVAPGGWRRLGRVWSPEHLLETWTASAGEAAEALWATLTEVMTDMTVPGTAVSLSGGIDSTLIAAAAAATGREVGAVSAVYPHAPSVDESVYIAATADLLGMRLTTYQSSRPRLDKLEWWVDLFDGPTHGLAIGPVDEMNDVAAGAGYQQVFSGEMAELVYDLREHAVSRMLWRGRLGAAGRNIAALSGRGMGPMSLVRMLGGGLVPTRLGLAYARSTTSGDDPAPWLDASFMPGLFKRWDLEQPARRRWQSIQEFFATGPTFPGLEVAAIQGEVAGVRTRRPLSDRRFWEFFLSLPPEIKFPDAQTKSLVRTALDGRAPSEVVWRQDKTVFDEDSRMRSDYPYLRRRLDDGFRLPGVRYPALLESLEDEDMGSWELSMARTLASIHAFVEVTS